MRILLSNFAISVPIVASIPLRHLFTLHDDLNEMKGGNVPPPLCSLFTIMTATAFDDCNDI